MVDKVKFVLAFLFLAAGITGFYLLSGQPAILRLLSILLGIGFFVLMVWRTEPGRRFIAFSEEAIIETKKVVWPSRQETVKMTGIVFAFVVVIAIFLWLTDKSLEWILYDLILGWTK